MGPRPKLHCVWLLDPDGMLSALPGGDAPFHSQVHAVKKVWHSYVWAKGHVCPILYTLLYQKVLEIQQLCLQALHVISRLTGCYMSWFTAVWMIDHSSCMVLLSLNRDQNVYQQIGSQSHALSKAGSSSVIQ